jgi:NAD-dependent deacetylase
MTTEPLSIEQYRGIVLLTGAGLSAASGVPTFRGADGLWRDEEAVWVSDAANLPASLPRLWKFYGPLREKAAEVQPNAAHTAIAQLQEKWGDSRSITLITQNVDELHQRAGSPDVVELHGSLMKSRCTDACSPAFADHDAHHDAIARGEAPPCPHCGAPSRPDFILFNEMLPVEALHRSRAALRNCDLFIAVGTSGTVSPASEFVAGAAMSGARTILVNLDPMTPRNPYFKEEILGRAEEVLPALFGF